MRQVAAQRLTETVVLILASLAGQPRHGYALIQDIAALSDGRVHMGTGTLFGALRRLLEAGWIERHIQADTSRDKQAYRLTAAGRLQLEMEVDRMRQLTRAARARMRALEV
jgi:DNA-binding PadR family transcriptional regulator